MSILNQIKAKNQKVIESCLTTTHLECAERMVELYHQKYEDFVGYNQLKREVESLIIKIALNLKR
jgi:hypothetical protein